MADDIKNWIHLKGIDLDLSIECEPLVINDNEILIPPPKYNKNETTKLVKYNSYTNQWNESIEYPNDYQLSGFTAAINTNTNILYIYSQKNQLIECNLSSSTWNCIETTTDIGHGAAALVVNDTLNFFGGYDNAKHLIWSPEIEDCIDIYTFNEYARYITGPRVIYIASKNVILFMGGFDGTGWKNSIYSYNIKDSLWEKLTVTLPYQMSDFGIILTKNQQKIIIFGGDTPNGSSNELHIMDVNTMKWRVNVMQYPEFGRCHAVNINDEKRSELTVFGYVHKNLQKDQNIPYDIINMITAWYSSEYIHIFCDDEKYNTQHYKINLDHILNA